MLEWIKRRRTVAPSRDSLLAAVPVKNELVRQSVTAGALRLSAPLRRGALARWFGGGGAVPPAMKTFEFDDLGAYVWKRIDNRSTVEDLIRAFSADRRVNLREAEVAVLAFLQTLARRHLIALSAPGEAGGSGRMPRPALQQRPSSRRSGR